MIALRKHMACTTKFLHPIRHSFTIISPHSSSFSHFKRFNYGKFDSVKTFLKSLEPSLCGRISIVRSDVNITREYLRHFCGKKFCCGSILGLSIAYGSVTAYAMDAQDALVDDPDEYSLDLLEEEKNRHQLWTFARKFCLPVFLFLTLLANLYYPIPLLLIKVTLFFLSANIFYWFRCEKSVWESMNTTPFMDKQIMDLTQGSSQSKDFIDLMGHPKEEEVDAEGEARRGSHHSIGGNGVKMEDIVPSYDFEPIRPLGTSSQSPDHDSTPNLGAISRPWSSDSKSNTTTAMIRNYGSLDSIEPAKVIVEKDQNAFDATILSEIDRTMKKHMENLLYVLEVVSARLTQLESRTHHLENSMDDLKLFFGNNHATSFNLPPSIPAVPHPNAPPQPPQQGMPPPVQHPNQFPQNQMPSVPQREPYFQPPPQPHETPNQQYQLPLFQQPQAPPLPPPQQQYQQTPQPQYPQPALHPPQQQQPSPSPVNSPPQLPSSLGHHVEESSYIPPQNYPPNVRPPPSQPPSGPPPSQPFYGTPSHLFEPLSSRSGSGFSSGYSAPPGPTEPYHYGGSPQYAASGLKPQLPPPAVAPPSGGNGYPQFPTARVLLHALPTASGTSGSSGSAGSGNRVPIDDVVDKVASMGFPRDHVRATVRKLTENGQSVDLNVVLDKLMNESDIRPRGWYGR